MVVLKLEEAFTTKESNGCGVTCTQELCIGYHMASRAIRDVSSRRPRETEITARGEAEGCYQGFPRVEG